MENKYRKYSVVMVLCFLVGGFSIILYIIQVYSAFIGLDVYGSFREFREHISNETFDNRSQINQSLGTLRNRFPSFSPERFLTSPASFILLFVGLISIAGGISIFNLVREKEIKSTKERLTSMLLTPEERQIIEEIKKSDGHIAQSQLVIKTGLSKVKIHRIIMRLESKGIVKKHEYGLTNKIILEMDA